MKNYNVMLLLDGYKLGHRVQYPKGTEMVYSTFTPRNSRIDGVDSAILFGLQSFIKKWLIDYYNENFFSENVEEIVDEYRRFVTSYLGTKEPDVQHIYDLHKLGYLPIKIMAVPEGTRVPMRVPMFTMESTHPDFYWITNYLETLISSELWYPITSANTSDMYRKIADKFAMETVGNLDFVPFTFHDFSFRGQSSFESAVLSGMSHLLHFAGTDTVPAILALEKYYNADITKELVGCSVNATEHAVMCAGEKDSEYETYKRLITEVYPEGIVSIVSDTWDFWNVVTNILPQLKDIIMGRNGTVTIRPDSGDPFKIICGDEDSDIDHVKKGAIEMLYEIFGGSVNNLGYKVLDSHISLIYGEAIQPDLAERILIRLKEKGFASTNVLFGVGSYGFLSAGVNGGNATRDTFGIAVKATYVKVNGEERLIFKDPKTDNGLKKSQTGMVAVIQDSDGKISYIDRLNSKQLENARANIMRPIFKDGNLLVDDSLSEIRKRLKK